MIRVLVIASNPLVRAGLSALVSTNPNLMVIASVSNWDGLTKEVEQLQPDVVLVDLGNNVQEFVWEQQYPAAILVIVDELDSINIQGMLRGGVRGILLQSTTESEIIAAVEAVALGLVVLHPDAIENLPLKASISETAVQALTPREIEVLKMLGSGLGNKAIAKSLQISEHTVKFHVSSIFQKLSVSTRTEAVTVGVRLGLILL
ncbi:MAG: response regulator transcription factor [Cyanomargarita calcarea GSE-NOS-MK-12-04C]|jgi:DNA-binding NarL/FixJ family response regulator|uniref:Response regulator transcription factor n=1 Tax=Cyanomargarita calcarea GSE-NOS-MK-12-04C TaxID=2839659 RepID=A0A951QT85_9CYAN|nr:response regulator transcription factor [Cyanomargarita calcarea GSE-NOS-MK-12-04C]